MTRPTRALHEGPNESCVIGGRALGWTNCTPAGTAMGIDKATRGAKRPSVCDVRRRTGDVVGGTNLSQNAAAAAAYGVRMEVHAGAAVCSPAYLASQLFADRGADLQGDAGTLVGTPYRSTGGHVNHNVYANEGRGWHVVGGHLVPTEVLVYDPAADGRRTSWGTAATSPDWWSWALVLKFAASLHPWGDGDSRTLGAGKMYAGFFPATHAVVPPAPPPISRLILRYGGVKTAKSPDRATAYNAVKTRRVNVRSKPTTIGSTVTMTLPVGGLFVVYQRTITGQLLAGSRTWYGSQDGLRWVHSSGLTNIGGAT